MDRYLGLNTSGFVNWSCLWCDIGQCSVRAGLKESSHYYMPLIILEFSECNCKILGILGGSEELRIFLYSQPHKCQNCMARLGNFSFFYECSVRKLEPWNMVMNIWQSALKHDTSHCGRPLKFWTLGSVMVCKM